MEIRRRNRTKKRWGCKIKPNLSNLISYAKQTNEISDKFGLERIELNEILDSWNEDPDSVVNDYRQEINASSNEPDIFIYPKEENN